MTNAAPRIYSEIYVTIGKNGKPRYSHWFRGRLFPVKAADAEASMLAGATIYRKQAGVNVFAEGGVEVMNG
jgi:hypothetical protein